MTPPPHFILYGFVTLLFGFVNGVAHFVVGSLIDDTTIRALIIACTTALITGAFGVIIALIQRKSDDALHARLDMLEQRANDIGGAVGANKRDSDPGAGGSTPTTPAA